MRYRDFITHLRSTATEDDGARIVSSRKVAETRDTWLSLVSGRDGGIAIVTTALGIAPRESMTFKLDPAITCAALADALETPAMMRAARSLLTPGTLDPEAAIEFAGGLIDLDTNPFPSVESLPFVTKPPSLDASLWRRIPHAKRSDYIKKMAMGIRRGVHPDDTVAELLTAA